MKFNKVFRYSLGIMLVLMSSCSEDRIEGLQTGTIEGITVVSGSNEVLSSVKISTSPATSTVFSGIDGRFTIQNVPEGTYSVKADKDTYQSGFEPANVLANRSIDVIFEMTLSVTGNVPPAAPNLISPANNSVGLPLTVEFEWDATDEDETDILKYTLTIHNDVDSSVLVFNNIEEKIFTVSNLNYGRKYFWQIAVEDGQNEPVLSEIYNFKTSSSPNLDFLFVRKDGNNDVIFSANDQGILLQLTSSFNNSWRPRRNSVTNKIAFLRSVGGFVHLFTMNEDGSEQRQVTNTQPINGFNFNEIDFTWSPQGNYLLYPSFDKIFKINVDGSGLTQFYQTTNGNFVTEIAWSRFNNVLAAKTNNSEGYNVEIVTLNQSGAFLETVFSGQNGGAGGLDLNIDGTKLLYYYDISGSELPDYSIQDARLFIYEIASQTTLSLVTNVNTGFNNIDPRFSPNENSVIYTEKGRSPNALSKIYSHDYTLSDQNFLLLFENASMPDWED
jgi:Tol biopolymer transport system component